jgi:putative redox protein
MFARHKRWPLENVHVTLTHDKIHLAAGTDRETRAGRIDSSDSSDGSDRIDRIDRIERVIELVGPLDEAQRARMMDIADRCPVHRTLHADVKIVTRAAADDAAPTGPVPD